MLAAMLFCSSILLSAADDVPTPAEIRDHLRHWHEDFHVLRIGYENTWPESSIKYRRELLLTDSRDYLEVDEWYGRPDQPQPTRQVRGGNQQRRFQASYVWDEENKEWQLTGSHSQRRIVKDIRSTMAFQPLLHLLDMRTGLWLDDSLLDHQVTVKPGGTIDGEECILVEVVYPNEEKLAGEQFWLAVEKDYLPKKVVPIENSAIGAPYYCEEFRFDGERWYPARGAIGEGADSGPWEVTEFEVNPEVSQATFSEFFNEYMRPQGMSEEDVEMLLPDPLEQTTPRQAQAPVTPDASGSENYLPVVFLIASTLLALYLFWWSRRMG